MKNLHDDCLSIPRLERVNYFYGQMLGVREFQSEQHYFHDKQRLHNRFLHGFGVVCGLGVAPCMERPDPCAPTAGPGTPPPPPPPPAPPPTGVAVTAPKVTPASESAPPQRTAGKPCVEVQCGLALSCEGDEIVVRKPVMVDLWHHLGHDGRQQIESGTAKAVWVMICYRASPVDPVRPIQVDTCSGLVGDCVPSRVRDDFCIKVKVARDDDRPHDCACSPCTDHCPEPCLVLARVDNVAANTTVIASDIDNTVRRPISLFLTTRITGISWTHGATYTRDQADKLLDDGIEFTFSDDVHGETITPGVIELWGIEGGEGRSGQLFNIAGEFPDGQPTGLVRSVRYRRNTRERMNNGDRVLITLRGEHVLDRCCRAVDGEHIGGRVPIILPKYAQWQRPPVHMICDPACRRDFQPWRSGNGVPGGTFQSWFFID